MKSLPAAFLMFIALIFTACGQNPGIPDEKPADILKNNASLLNYLANNLGLLTDNYTAYDVNSNMIAKDEFLRKLTSGDYLFIRLNSNNTRLFFELYKFNSSEKKLYGDLIYAYTRNLYEDYKNVGKKFPAFDFTDIDGNRYTSQNTRGKIIVLKCWFIGCQVCEEEMPALNALMQQYKNRKDVLFISLAPDSKSKLQAFFKKKRFDYQKVPGQNNFMANVLKVTEFPTHYIINKQGIIVNVVETPDQIAYSLKINI